MGKIQPVIWLTKFAELFVSFRPSPPIRRVSGEIPCNCHRSLVGKGFSYEPVEGLGFARNDREEYVKIMVNPGNLGYPCSI